MTNTQPINRLVSPLTLLDVEHWGPGGAHIPGLLIKATAGLISEESRRRSRKYVLGMLSESIEENLRRMLAACAISVDVPYSPEDGWLSHAQLKTLLAPTSRKVLRFADRRQSIWQAVTTYVEPISLSLTQQPDLDRQACSWIAWSLYLLALAAKSSAEVWLSHAKVMEAVDQVQSADSLNPEARARLAVIKGLFSLFSDPVEAPGFRVLRTPPGVGVSERIDEILEDAYLLEASQMRRFLGVGANVAAIRRDLRKLLRFITRHRRWAKGLVSVVPSPVSGGEGSKRALDALLELFPDVLGHATNPVLVEFGERPGRADQWLSLIQIVRTLDGNAMTEVTYLPKRA